jgi:hypothetical protein
MAMESRFQRCEQIVRPSGGAKLFTEIYGN